jgi:hypothetical protein
MPALRANDLYFVAVVDRNVVTQGMAESDNGGRSQAEIFCHAAVLAIA